MTTSYKIEAVKKLKAEKKILREQEAVELKQQQQAADKAHQENMARIEKKMAIINGEIVEEKKPVLKVFADTEDSFKQIKDQIINSFVLTDQEVEKPKNIYQVIN